MGETARTREGKECARKDLDQLESTDRPQPDYNLMDRPYGGCSNSLNEDPNPKNDQQSGVPKENS